MKKRVIAGILFALCVSGTQAVQNNGEVWYDTAGHAINAHGGGVLAHGGKYYLYGEHKVYGRAGNKAHVGVHIYSSDDLEKWKDEGIALKVEDKPGHEIEDGCVLERPKVLFCDKTGKFVMFFHLELKGQGYSAARVGIAVADKATGPYRFLRSLRPNAGQWPMNVPECERVEETKAKYRAAGKKAKLWGAHFDGGQMSRDMTLFKDDDGKAWHIFSSEDNSTLHIAELTDDYLDYTGRWWRAAELDWTEAAAVCKKDGWYYLVGSGCTGWKPNTARCYRAKSITGPWERLGNPCKGVNPTNGLGPDLTWGGQSNYILKKSDGEYLAMFDIWKPDNQIDSRLVWLPIDFNADGTISIEWKAQATMTTLGNDLYEAKSEFTMYPYSEEIFNTHLPSWRSENVMIKIVRQYRANYPDSTVTDREIAETLAGSELKLVPLSCLVTITVRSKSPELAAALANAYAEAIESFTDEENMKRCERVVAPIHQQVVKQRCVDDDLAARLLKLRKENKADGLQAEKAVIKQYLQNTMADISTIERRVTAASKWVTVLQAVQEKSENSGELPTEVPRSSELAAVYTKLQAVKMELTTLKTRFTSVHPAVVAKEGKLKDVAAEFADVVERAVKTARGDLEAYQKQLKDFRRKSEELKKKIKELDQKRVLVDAGLKTVEEEKIISLKVYQDLLQKENEARIAAELNNVIIRVGCPARIPSRPIGSSSQRNPAGLADDALVLPNGRRITRSMITGHRGDARSVPENTLMAFRRAVDNGFCFECDFYMTNDGEVYCVHDMNLKRTFGIAGLATNVCWKGTLDKVDVGAINGPQFVGRADCRVPRIDEVFALIPDDGRKITLEVKDPRPEIVPLIQAAWRRHPNMKEENIIFLAHKATRAALVKAFPRATFQHCVNCYSDGWRKGCTPIPVARQLAELDARPECRNFSPMFDLDLLTPDYISAVHQRGIVFYTWCVDRPEDAVEVFGRGVDGICSNCPVELWEGLKAMCATSKAVELK